MSTNPPIVTSFCGHIMDDVVPLKVGSPDMGEHVFAAGLPRLREAEVAQLDALRPVRVQQRVVQLQVPAYWSKTVVATILGKVCTLYTN